MHKRRKGQMLKRFNVSYENIFCFFLWGQLSKTSRKKLKKQDSKKQRKQLTLKANFKTKEILIFRQNVHFFKLLKSNYCSK